MVNFLGSIFHMAGASYLTGFTYYPKKTRILHYKDLYHGDEVDMGHIWLGYLRIMQNPGALATECSPNHFLKT